MEIRKSNELQTNIVHLCDCLEFMKTCKDNQFDLSICDPPYGIGVAEWDKCIPKKKYFDELFRISKNQIICGGNYFTNYLSQTKSWICWDKMQPEKFTMSMIELIWTSFAQVSKIYRKSNSNGNNQFQKKYSWVHPTQKPVALYKWLLKNYAKEGNTIFDSHIGSGSSRIACYELGFNFIGCELDKDYFEAQEKRFMEFKKKFHNEFYIPDENNGLFKDLV